MKVGSYGDVAYYVSPEATMTLNDMKWSSSANYAEHKVHGQAALLEYTGLGSDKVTFSVLLSAFLGVNPQKELDKLHEMLLAHEAHPLVLGTEIIGSGWVLTDLSRAYEHVYADGALLQARVQLTLRDVGGMA